MIPKFNWRRIGGVNIFELQGVFAEPWLHRNEEEMGNILTGHPSSGVLINLRELERIDRPGAEVILGTARKPHKGGILGQNLSTYFVAEHMNPNESIPIFERESEAIRYFGKEFAEKDEAAEREKRKFPRVPTGLPVELDLKEEGGGLFSFEAVVLNLSEGGFFGRFLDTKTEELARRILDPYDLKMLKIRLKLADDEIVKTEGKVLRAEEETAVPSGVAVEFYNLRTEDKQKIQAFLKAEGKGKTGRES